MSISNLLSKKKRKLAKITTHGHSLSLAVPLVVLLVVPLVVIRCHSLSLVVPLVVTFCHSLSLFINDWFLAPDFVYYFKERYGMIVVPVTT